MIDLRFGKYQRVLKDVTCDLLLVDAPYSQRTHSGHNDGSASSNRLRPEDEKRLRTDKRTGAVYAVGVNRRKALPYGHWTKRDVNAFVSFWAPRTRGWMVSLTDHELAPAWADAFKRADRYVFAPLSCVELGKTVRLVGDGPAQWSCFAIAARPMTRAFQRWGALPGAYVVPPGESRPRERTVIGAKPLWLMRALVRDYSLTGDVVCDPCAGGGTSLLAAAIEGRSAIGSEAMLEHYELAQAAIARGWTPSLFTEQPTKTQQPLFTGTEDK